MMEQTNKCLGEGAWGEIRSIASDKVVKISKKGEEEELALEWEEHIYIKIQDLIPEKRARFLKYYGSHRETDASSNVDTIGICLQKADHSLDEYVTFCKKHIRQRERSGQDVDRIARFKNNIKTKVRGAYAQAGECLQLLHEAGFVHRDFYDKNLMYLKEEDKWVLIDFGMASRLWNELEHGKSTNLIDTEEESTDPGSADAGGTAEGNEPDGDEMDDTHDNGLVGCENGKMQNLVECENGAVVENESSCDESWDDYWGRDMYRGPQTNTQQFWMAPESFEAGWAVEKSDVYSLGKMYEAALKFLKISVGEDDKIAIRKMTETDLDDRWNMEKAIEFLKSGRMDENIENVVHIGDVVLEKTGEEAKMANKMEKQVDKFNDAERNVDIREGRKVGEESWFGWAASWFGLDGLNVCVNRGI